MILWVGVLFTYQNTFITLNFQLLHCKYKTALHLSLVDSWQFCIWDHLDDLYIQDKVQTHAGDTLQYAVHLDDLYIQDKVQTHARDTLQYSVHLDDLYIQDKVQAHAQDTLQYAVHLDDLYMQDKVQTHARDTLQYAVHLDDLYIYKTRSRLMPEILSSCCLYIQALVLVFVDGYCDFNVATLICTLIIERNQCSYFDHVLIPVIF